LAVTAVFPLRHEQGRAVHPLAVLSFGLWFVRALVVANVTVAVQVLRPRLDLEQGIVAVPLRTRSPLVATFVANTITLTPGTLTVDIRPMEFGCDDHDVGVEPAASNASPVLYVHCLVTGDPAEVRAEGLALEERVVRAFGTAADRAAVELPPPAWPPTSTEGEA
jgi:multicomponent Na+:H+ antiporter subunit E